ncbi:MAG: VTT domain-containing protein [Candidatus Brockarchaeota archaeon]|nr:VTT domain-containing protein [Candidatus Brockarchaeota archaeon]
MLKTLLDAQQFLEWMEQLAYQYGYLGVFFLSFIGAVSVVFPIPYTVVIYLMGSIIDPLLIAVSGGLGSAFGELAGYALGYYGRMLIGEERRRKMDYMLKIFDRYGVAAIFLFALTPLPDDLLIIPLGIMRYNPVKFLIPCVLGKTLMCLILALGGRFSISLIKSLFGGEGGWVATLMTFLLLAGVIMLMMKIDWEEIFFKYVEKQGKGESKQLNKGFGATTV